MISSLLMFICLPLFSSLARVDTDNYVVLYPIPHAQAVEYPARNLPI